MEAPLRTLVGIDLRILGHDWLVARAGQYSQRMGAVVDLVYFLGGQAEEPGQRERLDRLMASLPEALRGRVRLEPRDPTQGLIDLSGDYQLMVVGSREPPALERLLKGPMATRVMRKSLCPVLVPRGERGPDHDPRLLVGVDVGGLDPERVLGMCAFWAHHLGGRLDAMYAEEGHLPRITDHVVREAAEREWAALRAPKLDRLRALLEVAVPEAHRGEALLRRGEPEDVITQLSPDYDVVFVGNRDREGLARFIMGAVAAQLVRRATCDVMVLPTAAGEASTAPPPPRTHQP